MLLFILSQTFYVVLWVYFLSSQIADFFLFLQLNSIQSCVSVYVCITSSLSIHSPIDTQMFPCFSYCEKHHNEHRDIQLFKVVFLGASDKSYFSIFNFCIPFPLYINLHFQQQCMSVPFLLTLSNTCHFLSFLIAILASVKQ